MRVSRSIGEGVRASALCLVLALATGCTGLFFHPQRGLLATPEDAGLDYRDLAIETADGVTLHGWFLPAFEAPARAGDAVGCTIVHFHGNAGNNANFLPAVAWLPAQGVHVLTVDYRGYGLSEGKPELNDLQSDVNHVLRQVSDDAAGTPEVDRARVVVLGQSLGGALSLVAVSELDAEDVRAVAVEGAFSGYRAIAREKLGAFPLTWPFQAPLSLTINNAHKPGEAVGRLGDRPTLIIHGQNDRVVPPHHGDRLYEAAGSNAQIWRTDTGHAGAFQTREWRVAFIEWLDGVCAS